jgi:hypothetical protein
MQRTRIGSTKTFCAQNGIDRVVRMHESVTTVVLNLLFLITDPLIRAAGAGKR